MIACSHVDQMRDVKPTADGCAECITMGDVWVHLRLCMTCGYVGCCDSSKNRHATTHFQVTEHPIIKSLNPVENWHWCYIDQKFLSLR